MTDNLLTTDLVTKDIKMSGTGPINRRRTPSASFAEDPRLRDRYGRHLFGQSLLLARRLVQAGVPVVQANMGHVQNWDHHNNIFETLKKRMLPPLDRACASAQVTSGIGAP